MHRLDVAPEKHFAEADYAGSEVLIYHLDSDARQVLLCCHDLSEKIADWAYGTGRPDYASRYRIFCFLDVGSYRRSGADAAWRQMQDDFLITRETVDSRSTTSASQRRTTPSRWPSHSSAASERRASAAGRS